MEEGSLVCFVDANRTGIFVVDSIEEEDYIEKPRKGPAIECSKKVWYLYDKMDKQRKLWKAFEEDIRPHSFDLSRERGNLNYKVSRSYGTSVGVKVKVRIKSPPVTSGVKSKSLVPSSLIKQGLIKQGRIREEPIKREQVGVRNKHVKVLRGKSIWHPLDILCEVALQKL